MEPTAAAAIVAVGCYWPMRDPPAADLVASATAGIESHSTAACETLTRFARRPSSTPPATPAPAGRAGLPWSGDAAPDPALSPCAAPGRQPAASPSPGSVCGTGPSAPALPGAAAPSSAAAAGASGPRAPSAPAGRPAPASPGSPAPEPACAAAQLRAAPSVWPPSPD